MSRIYESLRQLERAQMSAREPDARPSPGRAVERRRTRRQFLRVPVLVYGHLVSGEPFHEETHMVWVNSEGGMLDLATPVSPGQPLILANQETQTEAACRVVHVSAPRARRAYVAVAFVEAQAGFWTR
jgi:hypothetical protein